jgi:hypothetical protein
VPQQTPQTALLMKPSCLPVPPHRGHFRGGGVTSTVPFPRQPGQSDSPKSPFCFPVPSQRAHRTGTPVSSTGAGPATGFPQWLQNWLSSGMVLPQAGQFMIPSAADWYDASSIPETTVFGQEGKPPRMTTNFYQAGASQTSRYVPKYQI